jgi:hypothetical protein
MVLNSNRATHCNWTNGTCGRAVKLIAHKSERPDAGEGEFWDLQHPPIACVFKQDQSVFMLGEDAANPYAWPKDVLVLQPTLAKFKWQPSNHDKPLTVWRRNFEASPALCFTNYKVRSRQTVRKYCSASESRVIVQKFVFRDLGL